VGGLVHPDVEIHTERTVHHGRVAAVDWSGKGFDHIERRYAPSRIEETDDGVAIEAELQYVWSESGEVADSSPVRIELGIRDGLISSWRLFEERS
jgi:hypothetical protein